MSLFSSRKDNNTDEFIEPPSSGERVIGRIIHVNEDEGWGFISSDESGLKFTRIFFHWTGLNQDTLHFLKLERGMPVEFEVIDVPGKGLRAIRIKVLEGDKKDE